MKILFTCSLVSHMTCIWITDFENIMKATGSPSPTKSNVCVCSVAQSCLTLCTPWSVGRQAPPSMGFSGQEYWSGLPFQTQGSNPCLLHLLHCRWILYCWATGEALKKQYMFWKQHQDTPTVIAALFTILKRRKQAKYPPMEKWINKT